MKEVVVKEVRKGRGFNLPLLAINYSITGVFTGPDDKFDKKKKHKVNLNITKGPLLREIEGKIKVKKTNPIQPNLAIQKINVVDGMLEVRGFNIKIEGDEVVCGMWFVDENGQETKATSLLENMPARLITRIPALPVGEYKVRVVTQYAGATPLKVAREFTHPEPVSIG